MMSVPGIGPIISSAIAAAIGGGDAFSKGRDSPLGWALSPSNPLSPGRRRPRPGATARQYRHCAVWNAHTWSRCTRSLVRVNSRRPPFINRLPPTETRLPGWVGGLELRNVVAKYPFERSHRFLVIQLNCGRRDYSRSSCDGGRRSSGLVPGSRQDACAGRNCRDVLPIPR